MSPKTIAGILAAAAITLGLTGVFKQSTGFLDSARSGGSTPSHHPISGIPMTLK